MKTTKLIAPMLLLLDTRSRTRHLYKDETANERKDIMNRTRKLFCLVATLLAIHHALLAQTPALDFTFTGANFEDQNNDETLGWGFTVNKQISVTHLGLFDINFDGLV